MLGYEEHELEVSEETWRRLMHPDDLEETSAQLGEHLAGRSPVFSAEHRMAHKDGHWMWVLNTGKVMERDAEGKPLRATGIHQDISVRKKLEEDLTAALAASQTANRAKSAFLANMSHEIRTPMAGILGAGALLLDTPLGPEQRELAGMMVESTQLLLSIVNDILDLSKIEEGFLSVETMPTNLDELLAHVCKLFEPKAREKGIDIQLNNVAHDCTHRWFLSDPTRLRQILLNLVGNAVKFTNHGTVTITAELSAVTQPVVSPSLDSRDGSDSEDPTHSDGSAMDSDGCQEAWDLRVDIQDTGIGMSPYMVEHVFDRFQQADSSATRIYGGSGLGTTISKELARRLGGDVTVVSEEGKGSTFTLHLPVARAPAAHRMLLTAPPEHVMRSPVECQVLDRSAASIATWLPLSPRESDCCSPRDYRLTAILAEDNQLNRRILEKMLRGIGIRIIAACNGQAVLDLVRSGADHDLILMDIQMPICDGVTATKALRAQGYALPIVALTANVMESDLREYIAAGMNSTLPKPYSRARICEEIDRLLLTHALVRRGMPNWAAPIRASLGPVSARRDMVSLWALESTVSPEAERNHKARRYGTPDPGRSAKPSTRVRFVHVGMVTVQKGLLVLHAPKDALPRHLFQI
eukprot:jgi/Mesvir1/7365/Mv19168-RA.1